MPATTPIYGLPYMVGTDPPCFGPGAGCDNLESVFCDFARIVEAELDTSDAIIGRTATTIPMARVTYVAQPGDVNTIFPGLFNFQASPFDTVAFDTDDMVQLPNIVPRRNGIYRIDANMFVDDIDEIGAETEFQIVIGNDFDVATLATVIPASGQNSFRASTLYEFSDTAPTPRIIRLELQTSIATTATLFSASMTVYWHSDL